MRRTDRLFEIIQTLRAAARPVTAQQLAEQLEVTPRTVYRDMAALQGMRVPIEGEAGIGYIMRAGFDLPPLMFSIEEVEAIVVGLELLRRTGDTALQAAARRIADKITMVLPEDSARQIGAGGLYVSDYGAEPPGALDLSLVRAAIRDERKLRLVYLDLEGRETKRTIRPVSVIYYVESSVIAAWCELRNDFRHFRADRATSCAPIEEFFIGEGGSLRRRWLKQHQLPWGDA